MVRPKTAKDVNVVLHAANDDGRTLKLAGGAAEPFMHFGADDRIAEKRLAIRGGENEVQINYGKGLGHGWAPGFGRVDRMKHLTIHALNPNGIPSASRDTTPLGLTGENGFPRFPRVGARSSHQP
jgi:hypothetical protein